MSNIYLSSLSINEILLVDTNLADHKQLKRIIILNILANKYFARKNNLRVKQN